MSRAGGFPAPAEGLDDAGRRDAARCAVEPRFRSNVLVSPGRSARETAEAIGLPAREEPALADSDHGQWSGKSFAELPPAELALWLADPLAGTPGGEAMEAVRTRVGAWLGSIASDNGPICAITYATAIRAAVSHALDMPLRATLAIDIAPLSRTMLSFNGRWRLQGIVPFD